MNNINKIVITGFTDTDRLSVINRVKEHFCALDFNVIVLDDAAPEALPCLNDKDIEALLMSQLERESAAEKAMANSSNTLIICNKGTMDICAYSNDEGFDYVLSKTKNSKVLLRDGYDAVFHLRSSENKMDNRIISVWTGTPHLRLIESSANLSEKLIKEIESFLGIPEPLEIERKYLIEYPDIKKLEENPFCTRTDIIQTYIVSSDDEEMRLRQRGCGNDLVYFKTIKKRINDTTKIEIEERLSAAEYKQLLSQASEIVGQIAKSRYCLVSDNMYFEIDIYPFWQNQAVMEIELLDELQEITFPKDIKIIREVSSDKRYTNHSLAINHIISD